MQAARSDVFTVKKSGLDAFLYADVGAEANGSTLTILSTLARLDKDPWAEAARWAALPKAAAIDSLAQSISQMPLAPSALAGVRESAARLVQLLPSNAPSLRQARVAGSEAAAPRWVPITLVYFALAIGMALNVILMPKPSSDASVLVDQSSRMPAAMHSAARSPPTGAVVAGTPVTSARPMNGSRLNPQ